MLCVTAVYAQSDQEDLEKYWNYRSRFIGEDGYGGFISIGSAQGQSLPASSRDIDRDCVTDWKLVNSKTERHVGNGIMRWGDGTVHLGYYLAMLAMEYRNLKDANANTKATERELYYALKAYERLDTLAEVTLGIEAELNGFFLRDDVPVDFYVDENQANNLRFQHFDRGGYECVGSDYCKGDNSIKNGTYVSQDQIISLLFGFAFVKKFAGDAVYWEESEERFGDLAALYSHLMVAYLRDHKWRIKSPNGQKVSNRWGGDARAFNILFAKSAERVTGGKAIKKEDFVKLIKSAPFDGPCYGTQGCEAPDGWKSSHLWFHTKHKNGNPYGQTYE